MKRKIITTADGSKTIHLEEWNENYHSTHGAIQEAKHVFIKHGLLFFIETLPEINPIHILEIGFGTGLNAFITLIEAEILNVTIGYTGVEAFPVNPSELKELNYSEQLSADDNTFQRMHQTTWEEKGAITNNFMLTKQQKQFNDIEECEQFNILYFDAFGARVQPELWTESIFKKMYKALKPNGVLVTYSAKGSVRRAMQAVGFRVEKLPGPPGKEKCSEPGKTLRIWAREGANLLVKYVNSVKAKLNVVPKNGVFLNFMKTQTFGNGSIDNRCNRIDW